MFKLKQVFVILLMLLVAGCTTIPKSVQPVSGFELSRYLGKWYEIARLDHAFETGMVRVTATYSLRDDGGIDVLNRGFSTLDRRWQEAQGKAYFVDKSDEGYLKVSFFGPFYAAYVIFEVEREEYQYAFISGPNHDFLWLLSRTPTVSREIIDKFVTMSQARGFDTSQLIYVNQ